MRFPAAAFGIFMILPAFAEDSFLSSATQNVRANCGGISEELKSLQVMAGVNTAVTGIGTAAGVGAVVTGFKKRQQDVLVEEIEKKLADIETMSDEEFLAMLGMMAEHEQLSRQLREELAEEEQKSKNLGNWRTGLMAGNTATNVAGTIIAHKNQNSGKEIIEIVQACLKSVEELKTARGQARLDGASASELAHAQDIIDKCGKHDIKHLEKIPRRSEVAKWSSVVGIGAGASGTVTSAVANTDKTRGDNTEAGKKKEKNLNTASNVLAIAATAASGTATGFNAGG